MLARFARASLALALFGAALGCSSSHGPTPEPSLSVEAAIASVTLGEDCDTGPALRDPAEDCDPAFDGCGGWCTQTAVQLSIEAGDGDAAVPFEIVRVRLLDLEGRELDGMTARAGRVFDGEAYVPWDAMVDPGDDLSVSYETSAPDWTAIGGGSPWETYGMRFEVEVTVRVDGVERTLRFSPAMREPEIVT